MKRMAVLLLACLLFGASSCAAENQIGAMKVVNCQEWVSLRVEPDATSECLVEVPLGAVVANCSPATKAFTYAEYGGLSGYIMSQYLEVVPVEQVMLGDMRVKVRGEWTPMYLGTLEQDPVIQWLAPDTVLKECTESADGFVYGEHNSLKGYIRLDVLEAVQSDAAEGA